MGPFYISYRRVDHAPLPEVPPHVVSWIETGEGSVYLAADAALDLTQHRSFLGDKKADIGIWNSMYLSKPETRALLHDAAHKNYIYHMPANRPDSWGLWKKLELNYQRYASELENVIIWDTFPSTIEF